MIKLKKLALGTISTIAATAPMVVAVSCGDGGSTKPKSDMRVSVNLRKDLDNESIGSQLQLLPLEEQDSNFTKSLTELSSDGKKEMKKFTKDTLKQAIATSNPTGKTIMFKVTIADKAKRIIKEKVQKEIKQIQELKKTDIINTNNKMLDLELGGVSSKQGFESNFFEKIINSENTKDKMSLLAQAINDLEKEQATDFRVVMQLVLPKWLEEFKSVSLSFGDILHIEQRMTEYTVDQIQSVINEKNANVNLVNLDVLTGIKSFDATKLPSTLKGLDLSKNQLTTFDATKLPSGLKRIDLASNKLTTFDATKLPLGITKLNLIGNKLTTFDATKLPSTLKELNLASNKLTTFDATKLPSGLNRLYLYINQLTTFDATKLPSTLKELLLSFNQLATFDATKLPSGLKELTLSDNKLTTFDATKLPSTLKELNLANNKLTTFDATKLPSGITDLLLFNNPFSKKA